MKSLVVPVNFTHNAANAARYAADLALAIEADVHLLHVIDLGYSFEETEQKGRALLASIRKELTVRTKGQITISAHLDVGNTEVAIGEWCNRLNPFAVVMGAEDAEFHGGFTHGHVADAIANLRFPVLIIPAGVTFHAVRSIILACELKDIESEMPVSLAFLKELKDNFACRFEVINVSDKNEIGEANTFTYRWEKTLTELYPELHFIRSSRIEEGIRKYVQAQAVDWLMVFPKKHGFLEFHKSHSKRIVADCPVPVLSVRA